MGALETIKRTKSELILKSNCNWYATQPDTARKSFGIWLMKRINLSLKNVSRYNLSKQRVFNPPPPPHLSNKSF